MFCQITSHFGPLSNLVSNTIQTLLNIDISQTSLTQPSVLEDILWGWYTVEMRATTPNITPKDWNLIWNTIIPDLSTKYQNHTQWIKEAQSTPLNKWASDHNRSVHNFPYDPNIIIQSPLVHTQILLQFINKHKIHLKTITEAWTLSNTNPKPQPMPIRNHSDFLLHNTQKVHIPTLINKLKNTHSYISEQTFTQMAMDSSNP